jgi:hypothetical protein
VVHDAGRALEEIVGSARRIAVGARERLWVLRIRQGGTAFGRYCRFAMKMSEHGWSLWRWLMAEWGSRFAVDQSCDEGTCVLCRTLPWTWTRVVAARSFIRAQTRVLSSMALANAASRVHACLQRINDVPGTFTPVEGFALVLRVDCQSDAQEIAFLLHLLEEQIAEAQQLTEANGIPAHLFELQTSKVRGVVLDVVCNAPIYDSFQSVRDAIGADVVLTFAWLAHVLPGEPGQEIDWKIRSELLQILQETRLDLSATYLPGVLSTFLSRNLECFISALAHYELTGAKPLQHAIAAMANRVVVMDRQAVSSFDAIPEPSKDYWKRALWALERTIDAAASAGPPVGAVANVAYTTNAVPVPSLARRVLSWLRKG